MIGMILLPASQIAELIERWLLFNPGINLEKRKNKKYSIM